MRCIVVTGGMGFIGSHFIRYQLSAYPNMSIVNIDKLTYAGNPENLASLEDDSRYSFHQGDVCDTDFVLSVLQSYSVDAVVNFAAESHVDRSIISSEPFVHTNVLGTQVLMDACRRKGVQRFLQVSTDEVYGSLGDHGVFTEHSPLAPNSPYAASKAAADLLVRSYWRTFAFPSIVTRCTNNYGPYQFPEKLIPLFISNALNDRPLPLYGDGKNVREWIHVEDHCRGIDTALRRGRDGEVYNFGSGVEMTNADVARLLVHLLGKSESLLRFVSDRPGHDFRYAVDCQKARTELWWQPSISFTDGLRDTVRWYRLHGDWLRRATRRQETEVQQHNEDVEQRE